MNARSAATDCLQPSSVLDEARSTPDAYKWLPFRWENRPFGALFLGALGLLMLLLAAWLTYATLTGAPLEYRRGFLSALNSLPAYWRETALLSFAAVCALNAIWLFDRLFRRSAFFAVGKGGVIACGTFVDHALPWQSVAKAQITMRGRALVAIFEVIPDKAVQAQSRFGWLARWSEWRDRQIIVPLAGVGIKPLQMHNLIRDHAPELEIDSAAAIRRPD